MNLRIAAILHTVIVTLERLRNYPKVLSFMQGEENLGQLYRVPGDCVVYLHLKAEGSAQPNVG